MVLLWNFIVIIIFPTLVYIYSAILGYKRSYRFNDFYWHEDFKGATWYNNYCVQCWLKEKEEVSLVYLLPPLLKSDKQLLYGATLKLLSPPKLSLCVFIVMISCFAVFGLHYVGIYVHQGIYVCVCFLRIKNYGPTHDTLYVICN